MFEDLPNIVLSIIFERNNQPRLSFPQKSYYYLRPYIPLKVRHFLQSKRQIEFKKDWFISDKVVKMLNDFYGEEKFNEILKNLWGSDIVSPIVLTHDVETIDGLKYVPKVLELEEKYGFKSSWNVVPYLYDIPNEIINLIKENGCEVGVHGYNHDGKDFFSKNLFDKRVVLINKAIENFGGVGYRSPAAQRNLEWMQSLNIKYDSSCFDVDPYQPMPGGTHFIWPFMAGKFVELPYTLPQDHVLWIQLGEKNIDTWKKKTEWLMKYNGMILLITHPDYLMIGENMKLYEEFLIYVKGLNGVRNMLAREVAEFVIQNL